MTTSPLSKSSPLRFRIEADFRERLGSLLSDGYRVNHQTANPDFMLARITHKSNGNRITLKADFRSCSITQLTNNLLVFISTYA